jgi:hypothetical protein
VRTRERVTAFIVVGAIIALAMLIHGLTSSDQADVQADLTEMGSMDASTSDDGDRDSARER